MEPNLLVPYKKYGLLGYIVDEDVLEWAQRIRWSPLDRFYLSRRIMIDGRFRTTYLHRELVGLVPGQTHLLSDHINHNVFDHRRMNLRIVDHSGNRLNRESESHPTGFTCVHRRGHRFTYDWTYQGRRYAKAGYESAEQAYRDLVLIQAAVRDG